MKIFNILKKNKNVVSILRLNGTLSSGSKSLNILTMAKPIDQAFRQKGIREVVLDINCPGGSPVQTSLIYKRIRLLADEKKLNVTSFTQDVAASGGYWLACAGDKIYADKNSIIGSIGVISGGFGFQELIKKIGIERRLHTSGDSKSFLDPFISEKTEDVERLKRLQNEIHENFKSIVRLRRKNRLNGEESELFTGEFWSGSKARDFGLVDELGDIYSTMREKYGEKVKFKIFGFEQSWVRRRLGLNNNNHAMTCLTDAVIESIHSRSVWSRFGL
ncbi:MAG: S49 family peptidase [Rhodospirillaceae bacterium]|nr:S49 family peptidase [Rhodospirillaceae bacterium]|tara:strand:+ start:7846 stop:8670 length:825 start_codon:yes stop_codon:yes gene_type:complete